MIIQESRSIEARNLAVKIDLSDVDIHYREQIRALLSGYLETTGRLPEGITSHQGQTKGLLVWKNKETSPCTVLPFRDQPSPSTA